MLRRTVATLIAAVVSLIAADNLAAQSHCPTGELRAYSHNDYNQKRPLHDAISLGYSGVEVDVFLVDGVLRAGHDRKAARSGPRLDSAYLAPLRDAIEQCAALSSASDANTGGFLLNIEIKEPSLETLDALVLELAKYRNVQKDTAAPLSRRKRVVFTLVGYSGSSATKVGATTPGVSCKLERIRESPACLADSGTTMVSIDYGKTIGRWWRLNSQRKQWLDLIRSTKASHPGKLVRAYNVPVRADVYRQLFLAGVDYVGTKTLERTRIALVER